MRIDVSRLKYLVFVVGLGACFFDPKATGPGFQSNPQTMDSSVPNDGTAGPGPSSGTGGAGQSGGGGSGAISGTLGTGTGGTSGGAPPGTSGSGGSGAAGMSMPEAGSPPPPPPLVNGEACTEAERCASGHCDDGICCEKGSECCRSVDDCPTEPGGLGMSCDERSTCTGTAGKLTCTNEFKCVTVNGQPDDRACTNRVEANDCGLYASVFCLGGAMQQGAPPCPTSCTGDGDCDLNAHCTNGECVEDLPNGQSCRRNEDCVAGFCRNIGANGTGICCGMRGDCCETAQDCPSSYSSEPVCNNPSECEGTQMVAECNFNICSSQTRAANEACNGMVGDTCGQYQDLVCMAGRNNECRTSCTNMGDCDPAAFCDAGRCVPKRVNGGDCTNANQCMTGNCTNNVCCSPNGECCKTAEQCTRGVDRRCDRPMECQGTRRMGMCMNSMCTYGGERVDDDSACTTGGSACGLFEDIECNGMATQRGCRTNCDIDAECDDNAVCMVLGSGAPGVCRPEGTGMAGMGGMGGAGGAPADPGPGTDNGGDDEEEAP
jgi:hypothetical protein